MQALRHTEEADVVLSGAKRRSRVAFGRGCALESTASGTMLSARRSLFLASASRRTRPLMRREQELRFGDLCYRHNAQCAKKPLLCLREPQIASAAET
ncbi:unnamed protein product [Coccothraustes coccothraustes]